MHPPARWLADTTMGIKPSDADSCAPRATHYLFAMYQCIDTLRPSIIPLSWVILSIINMHQLGIEPQSSGLQLCSKKDLERLCHKATSMTLPSHNPF